MSAATYLKVVDGERIAVFPLPTMRRETWEVWKRRTEHRLGRIEPSPFQAPIDTGQIVELMTALLHRLSALSGQLSDWERSATRIANTAADRCAKILDSQDFLRKVARWLSAADPQARNEFSDHTRQGQDAGPSSTDRARAQEMAREDFVTFRAKRKPSATPTR